MNDALTDRNCYVDGGGRHRCQTCDAIVVGDAQQPAEPPCGHVERAFCVVLGNVAPRKGHRHDCSQVEIVIEVSATTKADAVARVQRMARDYPLTLALARYPKAGFLIRLNADAIQPRSVRVHAASWAALHEPPKKKETA